MKRVVIESPYAGDIETNKRYARAAMRDCILRGETPYASHLLLTQPGVLDDTIPEERQLGIDAGLDWGTAAEKSIVYTDLGMSRGMQYGIARAEKEGRPVEYRTIPGWVTEPDQDADARKAYEAYGDNAKWTNYAGTAMPTWENLPEHIKSNWRAAAKALVR